MYVLEVWKTVAVQELVVEEVGVREMVEVQVGSLSLYARQPTVFVK